MEAFRTSSTVLGEARSAHRPDVDGLRAVAVLAIFAFHLGVAGFPGGFVGVDVFFVISGFVITRGLLLDIEFGRFSLKDFYARRARRILPALIVTLLVSLAAGFVILSPGEMREFAGSALASLVSAANIFFHDRTDYFAHEAHYRPLLHTWSLSLEEQFYLVFPVLLGVLVVRGRMRAPIVVASLVVLSFAWCVLSGLVSRKHAFYMPMARFWEIGAGALLACAEARGFVVPHANRLALAGLGGIAASVVLLDGADTPAWMMALPVAAAAAVIQSGACGTGLAYRLLSVEGVVAIGRLSYSIYLLHWPVIVYWRMCVARPLHHIEQLAILAGVLAAAALLWRFVERPFRSGSGWPDAPALRTIGAGCAAVLALGLLVRTDAAALWLLNPPARQSAVELRDATRARPRCTVDPGWLADAPAGAKACRWSHGAAEGADFVIWGDSHAGALAPELASHLLRSRRFKAGLLVNLPHCPPVHGVRLVGPKVDGDCQRYIASVFDAFERHKPALVVIAGRWANLTSDVRSPGDGGMPGRIVDAATGEPMTLAEALLRTLRTVALDAGHVALIGPVPEVEYDVPATLVRSLRGLSALPPLLRSDFDRRQRLVLGSLARIGDEGAGAVLYPHDVLCSDRVCSVADGVRSLYSDDDHLSAFGAERVARALVPRLIELVGPPAAATGATR